MPYVDDDGNPIADPSAPASRGSGAYVYEPEPGVIIQSPTALSAEQEREALSTGFVRGVPEASVVRAGAVDRRTPPPATTSPPRRELPFGEYLSEIGKGFVKTAGSTAANVMDAGGAGMLGIGPAGAPNSRDALARFIAEKIGGQAPVEDPAGRMQPFKLDSPSEQIGGVGARTAMAAGGAGTVGAALPATTSALTMAGAQGATAGTEAMAAGDDPKVAALLGAGGTALGGAFQAFKNFRRGRADAALQAEIDALTSRPTPVQRVNEKLGVKASDLGKNPDNRYRPAEAVAEHGIDATDDVGTIRRTAQSRLDDLGAAKNAILQDPRMISTRRQGWDEVQNVLQPLVTRTARRSGGVSPSGKITDRETKAIKAHLEELDEMFNGAPAVGKGTPTPPLFSQGMTARDYQTVIDRIDNMLKGAKGASKSNLREGLENLRRVFTERLTAGNDDLKLINASRRDLGSTVKVAKAKEISEAASPGPTARPVGAPEHLSPGSQALANLSMRQALKLAGLPGGGYASYALARWLEEKLRGVTP